MIGKDLCIMNKKRYKEIMKELQEHREERIKKFQEWCKNTQPENACEKFWRFP